MKTNKPSRKPASIVNTRWAAYAAAGAATALAGLHAAEAEIHYSGLVNAKFAGNATETFEVVPGEILEFRHNIHYYGTSTKTGGSAFFHIFGPDALVAGFLPALLPAMSHPSRILIGMTRSRKDPSFREVVSWRQTKV